MVRPCSASSVVGRWMRGEQPELHRPRMHSLDSWRAVLERRWAGGCRNGAWLWRELRDAGFKGRMRGGAALMLPWSRGQVEGQVTRLKLVKRQNYGRAKLDLLRTCLVRAA